MDYFGLRPHQMGVGNVYYVVESDHAQIAHLTDHYEKTYGDSSSAIQATIQAALDVTVAERNDYVVIPPASGNVNLTTALTMSNNRVHLICPSNIGTGGIGFISPIIQQDGDYDVITLTAHNCEIAGLFFKGYEGKDIIDVGSGKRGPWVHDCFFGMSATDGSDNNGIHGTDGYFFNIHDNHFTNYSPGAVSSTDNDLGYFIYFSSGGTTRGIIKNNVFTTGGNTEVTSGIYVQGHDLIIQGNLFHQTGALGATETGTFTKGITADSDNCVVGNMFTGGITAGNCITGVAADSCVMNVAGTDGAIRVDPDGSHAWPST